MNTIFTRRWVTVSTVLAAATGVAVNGNFWGTGHLKELVPGVTIPDITLGYAAADLPRFFQTMGETGRAAYVAINDLDFLFIVCYSLFAVVVSGTMFRYLMKNQTKATWLAWLGLVPGLCDMVESACFRVIVASPNDPHLMLSSIAAVASTAKFIAIGAVSLVLLGLLIVTITVKLKKRHRSMRSHY